MSALTEIQRRALSSWGARNLRIRRIVLFGSRVKGTHGQDSDLDIAVEIESGEDSNATLATWMRFFDEWNTELNSVLPFRVDLQWRDCFGTTRVIEQGILEASELVYERPANNSFHRTAYGVR